MLPGAADTIVALATAPGRGAIAVVRVSGPDALRVVSACIESAADIATNSVDDAAALLVSGTDRRDTRSTQWIARRPLLRRLTHPHTREPLDTALVTWFPAPHSYTGDEVVEISTHGGLVAPVAVLAALIAAGAREALPGEFTRRAVMAGKMDVLQAEAVADLIDARSQALHAVALRQLDGGLSRRLLSLRGDCVQLEALLAYDIDFPEEDDGPIEPVRITRAVNAVIAALDELLATAPTVPLVREGAVVVLAGAPNAGKSSLFNALLGEARAIVSEIPGTTRDALDVLMDTPGVPIRLVDTAGLRESDDVLERMGIEVSAQWLSRAHVVVVCGETVAEVMATERAVRGVRGGDVPLVRVVTKRDWGVGRGGDGQRQRQPTVTTEGAEDAEGVGDEMRVVEWGEGNVECVLTSAETGLGLGEVLVRVRERIAAVYGSVDVEMPRLTRERHRVAVSVAREELAAFVGAWDGGSGVPAIVAAVHVRAAVHALDELIGVVSLDDVLDRLFAEFCVGK